MEGQPGKFGSGGNLGALYASSGGGGGYFGGGGGGVSHGSHCSGAGGSSFISGFDGCWRIKETSTPENPETENNPYHFSNLFFKHGLMISGDDVIPSIKEYGKNQYHFESAGAVRITFLHFVCTCEKIQISRQFLFISIFTFIK